MILRDPRKYICKRKFSKQIGQQIFKQAGLHKVRSDAPDHAYRFQDGAQNPVQRHLPDIKDDDAQNEQKPCHTAGRRRRQEADDPVPQIQKQQHPKCTDKGDDLALRQC